MAGIGLNLIWERCLHNDVLAERRQSYVRYLADHGMIHDELLVDAFGGKIVDHFFKMVGKRLRVLISDRNRRRRQGHPHRSSRIRHPLRSPGRRQGLPAPVGTHRQGRRQRNHRQPGDPVTHTALP